MGNINITFAGSGKISDANNHIVLDILPPFNKIFSGYKYIICMLRKQQTHKSSSVKMPFDV